MIKPHHQVCSVWYKPDFSAVSRHNCFQHCQFCDKEKTPVPCRTISYTHTHTHKVTMDLLFFLGQGASLKTTIQQQLTIRLMLAAGGDTRLRTKLWARNISALSTSVICAQQLWYMERNTKRSRTKNCISSLTPTDTFKSITYAHGGDRMRCA